MSDKPKLTLETALAEFPKECKALESQNHVQWCSAAGLAWAALEWLGGKPATLVTREFLWVDDQLRMLLEEVAEHLNREKQNTDPERKGQCWCCANNFPGSCPYEGCEFSPSPCDKWSNAALITRSEGG